VDNQGARYFDCNNLTLPFGPAFVADLVNRTHEAQDQVQCLLTAELAIQAQRQATLVTRFAATLIVDCRTDPLMFCAGFLAGDDEKQD